MNIRNLNTVRRFNNARRESCGRRPSPCGHRSYYHGLLARATRDALGLTRANPAQMTVKLSLADVANKQVKEWRSADGAGTLTVSQVNAFIYFTTRDVKLRAAGHNQ